MNPSTKSGTVRYLTTAGIIAAVYAVMTFAGGFFGLSYGAIQIRFAELMTIMPVFTPAAVPGLIVGCFVANLGSSLGVIDWVFGTLATALAAVTCRALRGIQFKKIPILSFFMPVIFNALIVSAEIALLTPEGRWAAFGYGILTVGAGELVVCVGLGIPFYLLVKKYASYIL